MDLRVTGENYTSPIAMNRIRWAPWPWGGAYRVRVTSSSGRWGTVSVIWQGGPLKGRPATLLSRSLRANRLAAAAGSSPPLELDYNREDWGDLE